MDISALKKDRKRLAPLLVIMAGVTWGFIGVFSRFLAAGGYNSVQIAASRATVTALSLAVYLLLTNRSKFRIHIKDLWMFFGTGVISILLCNICYFYTIEVTTLSIAAILLYTAPSFVLILSFFLFHEKFTRQKVIALILAFSGCVMITGIIGSDKMSVTPLGLLSGIGAGFCYALYSIFARVALRKYHPMTVTLYTFIVAGVCVLPFSSVPQMISIAASDTGVIMSMLMLGIIATLTPFLLYTEGLKHMETGKASVMAFLEPMVSTITGIVIFGEMMTLQNALGIVLIFFSVVLLNINFKMPIKKTEIETEPQEKKSPPVLNDIVYENTQN